MSSFMLQARETPGIEILRTNYPDLDRRQQEIAQQIREGHTDGAFLLAEVDPVITLGKRSQGYVSSQFPIYATDRGGLETYHGPGQWVLFPVFSVRKNVKSFFSRCLDGTLALVRKFEPQAEIRNGEHSGVWLPGEMKVASMGVRIKNGILQHGLSLNVYPTRESFAGVHPCGMEGVRPGFLLRDLGASEKIREKFVHIGQEWVQSVSCHLFGSSSGESTKAIPS